MVLRTLAIAALMAATLSWSVPGHILTVKQAEQLALNTPEVLSLNSAGKKRCPEANTSQISETIVWVQIRNRCPISGSGMIANYSVDLASGIVFEDVERTKPIRSKHLDLLRRQLFRLRDVRDKPLHEK